MWAYQTPGRLIILHDNELETNHFVQFYFLPGEKETEHSWLTAQNWP